METWIMIPSFSRYEASTKGRLRSTNYKNSGKTKVLKPAINPDGYLKTMLKSDSGKYRTWTVHSFVALAHHGVRPEGLEINHKDGVKLNNSPNNLEYVTKSENLKHAYRLKLLTPKVGSSNGMAKLNEEQVREIREQARTGGRYYGRKSLAKKYGVSECTIKEVVTRRKNKFYNA